MLKTLLHCKGSQISYSAITHVFSDDGNEDVNDGDVCDCSGEAGQ